MSDVQKMILASKISNTPVEELDDLFMGTAMAHDPVIQALIDKLLMLEAKYEEELEECDADKKDQEERIEHLEYLLDGPKKTAEKKDARGRKPVYPSMILKVLQDNDGRASRQVILEAIKEIQDQALKNFNTNSVLNAVRDMLKEGSLREMPDGSLKTQRKAI